MGSDPCPGCGTKAVRHLYVGHTELMRSPFHYDVLALPFDFEIDRGDGLTPPPMTYWMGEGWRPVPTDRKRFWLPFPVEQTYEDAMATYTLWLEETKKTKHQLVVFFRDEGCMRGGDHPWTGIVYLAAFRGPSLDFIEDEEDVDMEWLARAYRWAADPKTKFTDPPWPHP